MALATSKSLFIHCAKCAGHFIRHAYKVCSIEHFEIGHNHHNHFPALLNFYPQEFYNKLFSFAFVRHPLTWYQSRWAFRLKHGWRLQHPLDLNCAANDFETFVNKALAYCPTGWVNGEYNNSIDTVPGGMKFVGRVENLLEDLFKAFDLAGELYNRKLISSIPRVNDGDLDSQPSSYWATYTPTLLDKVLITEQETITKYYKDYKIDYNKFCKPRPY